MKLVRSSLVLAAMILPLSAHAIAVTWELRGVITEADVTGTLGDQLPVFAGIGVGDTFTALLTFDTDATLLRIRSDEYTAPGVRYEYDPSSMSYSVQIGTSDWLNLTAANDFAGNLLYARDNSGDTDGPEVLVDGYTFGMQSETIGMSSVMRGPVLDIVNGAALSETPDARLADLNLSLFQFFARDGLGHIYGDITSIGVAQKVPEPSTLAVFGVALAGLAVCRRRRKHAA